MVNVPAPSSPYGETIQYGGCDCCSGTPPCNCCLDAIPDCTVTITDAPLASLIGVEVPIQVYDAYVGFFCVQSRQTDDVTVGSFGNWPFTLQGVDITAQVNPLDLLPTGYIVSGSLHVYLGVVVWCGGGDTPEYHIQFRLFVVDVLPLGLPDLVNGVRWGGSIAVGPVPPAPNGYDGPTVSYNCCPFALTFEDVWNYQITGENIEPTTPPYQGYYTFALTGTRTGCTGEGGGD